VAQPFQFVTLATARQQIANRLYDPDMVFWTAAELTLYIAEALQTWNALAQYWRGDFVFTVPEINEGYGEGGFGEGGYGGGGTDSATWTDLSFAANTLRPYTVTDVNLYTIMQYHLLEPPTGATWTGTGMYTINDFVNAVQRRCDELLTTTGCTITQSMLPTTPGQIRNSLSDTVLDVRRIAWFPTPASPADGILPSVMWPEDVWAFQAYECGTTTLPQGVPQYYAISTQPPLSFDVDAAPQQASEYELLTVNAGPALTTKEATVIDIPTDFAWVLKWGAMADLLSKEAEAKDEGRADYCNQRYQQGMALLTYSAALLQFRINNIPLWIDAVRAADEYDTSWQAQTPGVPTNTWTAGLNLIALSPQPTMFVNGVSISSVGSGQTDGTYTAASVGGDGTGATITYIIFGGILISTTVTAGGNGYTSVPTFTIAAGGTPGTVTATISPPFSASATVVQNAPIPVNDGDFLQVSRGDYDVIIDLAQHLALFKCGGAEFTETKAQWGRFVRQAALYNSKLKEMACFQEEIYGTSQREEAMNPRLAKDMADTNG
jgi:hypothetical protein